VRGLDAGADDYSRSPSISLSSGRACVRSRGAHVRGSTLLRHGALAYDQVGRVASLNGAPLDSRGRELNLLEILLARAGRMVSKEQLVSHLCAWGEEVSPNAIEVTCIAAQEARARRRAHRHRERPRLQPGEDGAGIIRAFLLQTYLQARTAK